MNRFTTFVEGIVVDTNDPQQMGRVRAWCPGIDGEAYEVENLPWASYISPLAGHAFDYPAGALGKPAPGPVAYGWWSIPKRGAIVIIGFLYGDYNRRFYLGCVYPEHSTRSLPAGRNTASGAPQTDTLDDLEPTRSNLNAQFQGQLSRSEARTRGAYERMAGQPKTDKDGSEGYQRDVFAETAADLDPQTYCFVTPGRHAIIMQDNPETARVRIKTADGTQVILDDANERIYISTAKGRTWLELDSDGHVHLFAAESVSVSSGKDINFSAKGSFNVHAGGNINLSAVGHLRGSACKDVSLSADSGVNITSKKGIDIKAAAKILQTGSQIHLNGPAADEAPCADLPTLVPEHEPWTRPPGAVPRNKNWKP